MGLELNNGVLLAWLVVRGYSVFGIQPKSAQRFRDIYRPSGSKDDRNDAFVLAEFVPYQAGCGFETMKRGELRGTCCSRSPPGKRAVAGTFTSGIMGKVTSDRYIGTNNRT